MKTLKLLLMSLMLIIVSDIMAQNPYLPLWEHIPDGEPRVFEDPDKPGEYRAYIFGSHDIRKTEYCGSDQVLWSAPVDDLTNWRYEGVIFKSIYDRDGNLLNPNGEGDLLYAPDVVERIEDGRKVYYFYPNNQAYGRKNMVAKSYRPDGPYEVCNWSKTDPTKTEGDLAFDPSIFIDDDGRIYGYWGFDQSMGCEIDPETLSTVKKGTEIVENLVPSRKQDQTFRFYEASSMRKVGNKYVLVYSRWTADGDFGLPESNYTLAYAYGDNPLGPFKYGGTIIDARGRGKDESGNTIVTAYPTGNTHGSICEIDGKWWVFYHRQTGTNEFARQPMVAPIEVKYEKKPGGKVYISEGEVTSEGFMTEGLNPCHKTPAGIACHLTGPRPASDPPYGRFPDFHFTGPYIKATYLDLESYQGPFNYKIPASPVINTTNGSIVGYKYFNMTNALDCKAIQFDLIPEGIKGKIDIMMDSPYQSKGGIIIGSLEIGKNEPQIMTEKIAEINLQKIKKGKHALYFVFTSDTDGKSICELHSFRFIK